LRLGVLAGRETTKSAYMSTRRFAGSSSENRAHSASKPEDNVSKIGEIRLS
jgi:hypothetical protein